MSAPAGIAVAWPTDSVSGVISVCKTSGSEFTSDPAGSDLRPADASLLPDGGDGSSSEVSATAHTRRLELWHGIAIALLLLLLIETVLLLR